MTAEKQAALERAGFRVGTIQEWLGLSDAEMSVIDHRIYLEQMYASVGRMNDAIAAGDKSGYEREVNKQVELRGRFLLAR